MHVLSSYSSALPSRTSLPRTLISRAPAGPDSASKGLTRPGTEEAHNWVRRGDWTVACYLREEEAAAWSAKDRVGKALSMASRETQGLQEEGLAAGKEVMPIHLQVVTSAKLPELVLDGPVEWRPEIGCYQMAFGEVALGQRVLKTLIVFNNGPRTIQPQVGALHHRETFSVVNRR